MQMLQRMLGKTKGQPWLWVVKQVKNSGSLQYYQTMEVLKNLYLQMKLMLLTDEIIQTAASRWIKHTAIVPHQPMIFGNQPRPWSIPWKPWSSAGPADIKNFNHSKRGLSKPRPKGPWSCRVVCPTRDFDVGKWDNCASRHSHTQNAPSRVNQTWILCQTWGLWQHTTPNKSDSSFSRQIQFEADI